MQRHTARQQLTSDSPEEHGESATAIHLHARDVLHLANARLTVLSGAAWITIDGDPSDYILRQGERIDTRRSAVAQSIGGMTLFMSISRRGRWLPTSKLTCTDGVKNYG